MSNTFDSKFKQCFPITIEILIQINECLKRKTIASDIDDIT